MEEELLDSPESITEESDKTEINDDQANDQDTGAEEEFVKIPKKQWETTIHQKKHFQEKVKELTTSFKDEDIKKPSNKEDNNRLDKLELKQIDSSLSDEEITEILSVAKNKGVTLSEAYNTPIIQAYIKSNKKEKASDDATLITTRSPKAGTKNEGVFKPNMTDAEKRAAYYKLMNS